MLFASLPLANTEEARQRGLMHVRHLPERAGLLFDFTNAASGERPVYMWMKNTPLSLDMIFVKANGHIVHIEQATTPQSEDIISSRQSVRFVIEMAAGQAQAMGWSVGDCITFKGQLPLLPNMCK